MNLLIENVRLIPMDRERVVDGQAVLVQGERIAAIGPAGALPAGTRRIDGCGGYLLPGLADLHVHLFAPGDLLSYLAHGVTTIAELSGSPMTLRWRDARLPGPTLFVAGTTLDGYPPLNAMFHVVETPARARSAIRDRKRAGYDFVKLYGTLNPEVFDAILTEARRQRIAVVGHVARQVGMRKVLTSGQAMIAHGEEFLPTWFQDRLDEGQIPAAAEATARAGVAVVPNLSVIPRMIREIEDLRAALAEPEMRWLSPAAYSQWIPSNNRNIDQADPKAFVAWLKPRHTFLLRLVRALHDSGVPLVLGTDSAAVGFPGLSAHEELRLLVEAGLTPYQALVTATRDAGAFIAKTVPHARPFGTIAVGQRADLLLLRGNPLDDIAHAASIQAVMARGRWWPRAELERARETACARYPSLKRQVDTFDRQVEAGRTDDAARTFRALRKSSPGAPPIAQWVLMIKGQRFRSKDPRLALALARGNVALYPDAFAAYTDLALAHQRLGEVAAARAAFHRSLALAPGNGLAFDGLERLEALLRRPRFDPVGRYDLWATIPRQKVVLTLRITGSPGHYHGSLESTPPVLAGMTVKDLAIGGDRLWATVDVPNRFDLELRLRIQGDWVSGSWVQGYENNGPITGKKAHGTG